MGKVHTEVICKIDLGSARCVQWYRVGPRCSLVQCLSTNSKSVSLLLLGPAQQALQTPQTMLDEVVWCVSDPPQQARLDPLHPALPLTDVPSYRYARMYAI